MMYRYEEVDFHIHSTVSDGELTQEEIINRAYAMGKNAIAITDHNIVGNIAKMQQLALEKNICLIPGVEFTVVWKEIYFHLLAYLPESESSELQKLFHSYSRRKFKKLIEFQKKIADEGIHITNEQISVFGRVSFKNIAKAMVQSGYANTFEDAMSQYIDNREFFDNRVGLPLEDVIAAVHGLDGITVLAHPFHSFKTSSAVKMAVEDLVKEGLDGIECYNGKRTEEQTEFLRSIARQYDLIETAGSDFHRLGENVELGVNEEVSLDKMNDFIRKVAK